MNTKSSIFTSVHEWNKSWSNTEKSNALFLLCFKIAKIKFIPVRQQSQQRNGFFSSSFTSKSMLPACLLGMVMVVN